MGLIRAGEAEEEIAEDGPIEALLESDASSRGIASTDCLGVVDVIMLVVSPIWLRCWWGGGGKLVIQR